MNAKTTIALLILAGALGALLYVTEITDTGDDGPDIAPDETGQRLFPSGTIESASAASVTIATAGGSGARFVKDGDAWRQTEPVAFAANGFAIDRVVDAVGDLRSSSSFTPADKNYTLDQFELDPPRHVLTIETGSGSTHTIALGKTSAAGRAYAIADYDADNAGTKTEVAIIDERVHELLKGDPSSTFRDRALPSIDAGAAASVTLTRGEKTLRLSKVDGQWKLGPEKHRASAGAVSTLAGAFTAAQINEFITDAPEDAATYGLDKPAAVLTVTASLKTGEDGSVEPAEPESHTLRIGNATDLNETHYFASLDDTPTVFTVPKTALDRTTVGADDLRDPKLTALRESNLTQVTIKQGDATVSLAKTEGLWKFAEPGPGFEGDGETIADAVASIFDARATGYADISSKKLAKPIATIELSTIGQDKPSIVGVHPHEDGTVLTLMAGESIGRIVAADTLEVLLSPAWAMRDRTIVNATIDDLSKVTIGRTGEWPADYTIARKAPKAEGPSPELPKPGEPDEDRGWDFDGLERQRAIAVLGSLAPFRAESWRAEPIAAEAKNVATVSIETTDGTKRSVRIDLDAGVGMVDGIDRAFVLREGMAGAFAAELRDTRVLTLDVNQIASITNTTHGWTLLRTEAGEYSLEGDGEVDEQKAAALFNTVASLRAERFKGLRIAAMTLYTLKIKMRDGSEHQIIHASDRRMLVDGQGIVTSEATEKALGADPRVQSN